MTASDDLRELFREAAELAKVVPEAMQAAAFNRALDELLDIPQSGTKRKPPRSVRGGQRRKAKASRPKRSGRKPTSGRAGPKAAVEGLIEADYFKQKRVMGEITNTLQLKTAHKYKSSDLSPALGRLVREGRLSRVRNSQGKYEYKDEG